MSYYLFLKNRLYQATVIGLLLPFFVLSITSITTLSTYSFSLPLLYLLISALPIACTLIKVSINVADNKLIIARSVFDITFHHKNYVIHDNEEVTWRASTVNHRNQTLWVGQRSTGLTIHV
jgi:hypothetical protein